MVEPEYGVGADELLDEQRRRADFACRVLYGAMGIGIGIGAGAGGGQLSEVNGLAGLMSWLTGTRRHERHVAYCEHPPAGLKLMQYDA